MTTVKTKAAYSAGQAKARTRKKNTSYRVPEAYGSPAETLQGVQPAIAEMGIEVAENYLAGDYQGETLAALLGRLRGATPAHHLPSFEAGLLTRLDQFMRGQPMPTREAEQAAALALGNQAMKLLHDLAVRVSAAATAGEIVPRSGSAWELLNALNELSGAITCVGPAARGDV